MAVYLSISAMTGARISAPPEIPDVFLLWMPCKAAAWQGIVFLGYYVLDRYKYLWQTILDSIARLQSYCSQRGNGRAEESLKTLQAKLLKNSFGGIRAI
jgi:hypothetical protein